MNTQELKQLIRELTLSRKSTNLFKCVLAECERYNKTVESVVNKMIQDNENNYSLRPDPKFLEENNQLRSLLPLYISKEEVEAIIKPMNLDKSKKSIGLAIKELKNRGLDFRVEHVMEVLNV